MQQTSTKKLLIVLLADKTTHENMGRALHALLYAKQAKSRGLDVEVIFDGGGTEWPAEMSKKESHFNSLYEGLLHQGVIKGACAFCSRAFKVEDELKAAGATFIGEDSGHPDIGGRIAGGWEVVAI